MTAAEQIIAADAYRVLVSIARGFAPLSSKVRWCNDNMTAAKVELDNLLSDSIKMATRLIEKHGSHIPFVMAITVSGEKVAIAADDTETSDPQLLLRGLRDHLREHCSPPWKYRAVALADNIEHTSALDGKRTDAVRITLHHLGHGGVTCYLPYELRDGKVLLGQLFAVNAEESFFTLDN